MDKKDYATFAGVGLIGIVLWFLMKRKQNAVLGEVNTPPSLQDQFTNDIINPINTNPSTLFGGPNAFQSSINVNVSGNALSYLTNKYIPLFGFVGVTAIGAQ